MSQKNRNTLEVPLPRNMREADTLGYVPWAGVWDDLESQFISENEVILTGRALSVAIEPDLLDEDGRDPLPGISVRFTAHFKFGPIEPEK